jgi:stearoyl-CoA desaturase (delta-9 desaturase)
MQQLPAPGSVHWRNVVWFTAMHFLAVAGIWYHVTHFMVETLVLAYAMYLFRVTAIAWGYHKLYSHGSFECVPALHLYVLVGGAAAFQNSVLWWQPLHIEHHADTDGLRDPHSITKGFWWAHMGWMLVHGTPPPTDRQARLRAIPLVVWQERWLIPLGIGAGFVLPTLIGALWGDALGGFLMGGPVALIVAYHCTWWVNSGSHTFGVPRFNERGTAKDSWLSMLFSGVGEGKGHSFHHKFPWDYRNDPRWWAFDPAKWVIYSLSLVGLVTNLKRAPPEMVARVFAR